MLVLELTLFTKPRSLLSAFLPRDLAFGFGFGFGFGYLAFWAQELFREIPLAALSERERDRDRHWDIRNGIWDMGYDVGIEKGD